MDLPDLTFVYGLFGQGLVFGAGLGAVVWLIGYAISAIYKIIRRS